MSIRNRFLKGVSRGPTEKSAKPVKPTYTELTLGVWRVRIAKDSRPWVPSFVLGIHAHIPLLYRVFSDVYALSPPLFMCAVLTNLWDAIEGPLSLYFSNRLIFFIERSIMEGDGRSANELYWAVLARVVCTALSTFAEWMARQYTDIHSARVTYSFEGRLYAVKLALDLPTFEESDSFYLDADSVITCLESTLRIVKSTLSFLLQLRFILTVIGSAVDTAGPAFVVVCLLPLFAGRFVEEELWGKAFIAEAINIFYIRKQALQNLVDVDFKPEVMGGGISDYFYEEYRKATHGLRDTPEKHPEALYGDQKNPLPELFLRLCSDSPMLYFAFLALVAPSKLSLAQLAILQQTSLSLRYTFSSIEIGAKFWPGELARVSEIYRMLDLKNKMKDGETVYPQPGCEHSAGMSIEFRNVSFAYPNTKSDRPALTDASFTIKPGQLVVIVGANGSGKTTIIKLLSRYYDVNSGTILVDGIPIQEYRMQGLRSGIAMLSQDHRLFPLSIGENIGLGAPEKETMNETDALNEAARLAGADGIIDNLKDGFDTILDPVSKSYVSFAGHGNSELEEMHKAMEKSASVSGGEKQRLVAARTFMRLLSSPGIKLVSVDEPSSALDPAGEYQLFSRLREARKGRTMIFVTHRFGHLTKYADLIICVKDGAVVETGTHQELLARAGEYAHLYNVQAQAFTTA